jgi:hypothetical protein
MAQIDYEEELPLPPPKKKASTTPNDAGGLLPRPPLKKYTILYFWHRFLNWFNK